MSYPNAGVAAFEFTNLWSVDPEFIKDIFDALVEASPFKRRVIWRYANRGYDPITGLFNAELKSPCDCHDDNFGISGRTGFKKCSRCSGAGVVGGWVNEPIDCFYWNQIPPGLQKFGKLFTIPLPIDRATVVIYVRREEKIRNGDYIINTLDDGYGNYQEHELQVMNVRPVIVGESIIWKWMQCQRQAVDVTTEERAPM